MKCRGRLSEEKPRRRVLPWRDWLDRNQTKHNLCASWKGNNHKQLGPPPERRTTCTRNAVPWGRGWEPPGKGTRRVGNIPFQQHHHNQRGKLMPAVMSAEIKVAVLTPASWDGKVCQLGSPEWDVTPCATWGGQAGRLSFLLKARGWGSMLYDLVLKSYMLPRLCSIRYSGSPDPQEERTFVEPQPYCNGKCLK